MRKRRYLTWLGSALLLTGAALLGGYVWNQLLAGEAQLRAKEWLEHARKAQAAPQSNVVPHAVSPRVRRGDTLAELEIPRLRMSVAVFEGADEGILRIGAGHIQGTALPGKRGNIGIAAHRDTFFRSLRNIHRNDTIQLTTPAGVARCDRDGHCPADRYPGSCQCAGPRSHAGDLLSFLVCGARAGTVYRFRAQDQVTGAPPAPRRYNVGWISSELR
jgi:hypothetical protein